MPASNSQDIPAEAAAASRLPSTVDVVIVNWNTSAQALRAADEYAASSGVAARVVIVDNDSTVEQKEILRSHEGGKFELIENRENLGFGAAANRGLSSGNGEFVVISNADVCPEPAALAAMAKAAAEPGIGMVGPVFGTEGQIYHDKLPGPLTLVIRTFFGSFGRSDIPIPARGERTSVEQPSGACFLMSRSRWQEVGGFDEGFFLWYEDVDLARRLHDIGMSGLVVGDAHVSHLGGESFERVPEGRKQEIRIASIGRYMKLHHPLTHLICRPLLWLSSRIRARAPKAEA